MAQPTVDEVAAELCALPLGDFTAARNARAAATSDRAVAGDIRALRKPSLAAWVVDLLARSAPDDLAQAFEIGDALREAQEELDAATLAELTKQRRALVAGLARQAVALAADAGVSVSAAARDDVEKTLNAGMRDADAASAVLTTRLVRALDAVGFDPVDLEGAVAGSVTSRPPAAPRDDLAERRARKAAEKTAREATQAAATADRELAAAEAAVGKARERADRLHERISELQAELARIEADADRADAATAAAEEARAGAAQRAKKTRTAADAAQAALDGGSGA